MATQILGNDSSPAKQFDPFTADDAQLAEMYADPEGVRWLHERDAEREAEEAQIAAMFDREWEEMQRQGNDFGG